MRLNIGLCLKMTEIRTNPVLVARETANFSVSKNRDRTMNSLKRVFCFYCYPLKMWRMFSKSYSFQEDLTQV